MKKSKQSEQAKAKSVASSAIGDTHYNAYKVKSEDYKTRAEQLANNVFRRGHSVTPRILDECKKRFPGWTFEFGMNMPHSHPVGAVERAICEELVYREITREYGVLCSISDIGGNANRHADAGRLNIHSCNPVLSSSDAVRRRPSSYLESANYCKDTAQDCRFVPDVYMSIHSLYYLNQNDILNLIHRSNNKVMYAVVHRFDKLYGSFHDNGECIESKYSIIAAEQPIVHMQVVGNCVGYTHPACLWLNTNYYSFDGKAMAWDGRPVGDSWIYKFVDAPIGLAADRERSMSLVDSIKRDDYHGVVNGVRSYGDQAEFNPTLEFLKIKTNRFVSCGSFLMSYKTSTEVVCVPKDLIKTVALKMVGHPRDKAALKFCVETMKSSLKSLNMPIEMKITCATHGSAMAFIYSLDSEISAFNTLCQPRYIKLYAALNRAMSIENLVCCGKISESEIVENLTTIRFNDNRQSVPSVSFNARKAWPKGLPGVETAMPLKQMRRKATIKIQEDDVKEYPPQMHPNCITFSNYIPVVPNPSTNNEHRALVNRALMDTPVENNQLWAEVHKYSEKLVKNFETIDMPENEMFEAWNDHYPPKQQMAHIEALVELRRDGLLPKDFLHKMFVKRECTLKGGFEPDDFDPRAIQGATHKVNVAYGPFIWHASKVMSKHWNAKFRICYSGGMTAEEIGDWRKQFDGMEVTIIELDESRYDAHQQFGARRNSRLVKEKCGLARYPQAALVEKERSVTRGYSMRGHCYRVPFTMTSGEQDTSYSNTFNNGSKTDFLLRKAGLLIEEYMMLIHGDDSFIVVMKSLSERRIDKIRNVLVNGNYELGFEAKCKISRNWYDVEYCSSLFWPVKGGYVLGPKIGKRLPKIGFGINSITVEETKGMLIGLVKEVGHLPVLGMYADYCLSKLDRVEERDYIDKRKRYKSLPEFSHERTQETDLFFQDRYGFTAGMVEECLRVALSPCSSIHHMADFPMLELLMDVDT